MFASSWFLQILCLVHEFVSQNPRFNLGVCYIHIYMYILNNNQLGRLVLIWTYWQKQGDSYFQHLSFEQLISSDMVFFLVHDLGTVQLVAF